MVGTKVISLLKSLQENEIRAFRKFAKKNYSGRQRTLLLFNHILKYKPDYTSPHLQKEFIINKVYANDISSKALSNEASKIYTWLEDFLIYQKLESGKEQFLRELILLREFKERQMVDQFFSKAKALKISFHAPTTDIWDYLKKMILNHELYYFVQTNKLTKKPSSLFENLKLLDLFHHGLRLKYQSELNTRNIVLRSIETESLPELGSIDFVNVPELEHIFILLYSLAAQLITTNSDDIYNKLEENYIKFRSRLRKSDQFILLTYLINYNARLIKQGDLGSLKKLTKIYQYASESNLLTPHNYIDDATFSNIVVTACQTKDFEWAYHFIEKYHNKLQEKHKESILHIAKAQILFAKGKYEETVSYLNDISFPDVHADLTVRFLLLRSWFELKEELVLVSYINATESFLRRNKILSRVNIAASLRFLRMLRILIKKPKDPSKFIELIKGTSELFNRNWLLEKAKEL